MTLFSAVIQLALPLVFGRGLVDRVLIERQNLYLLNLIAVGTLAFFVVKGLLNYGQIYILAYAGQRMVYDLRNAVFEHLQRLSLSFYERTRTGETISRVTNDVSVVQNAMISGIRDFVNDAFMLMGITVAVFWLHWRLSVVTLLVLPLVGMAVNIYGTRIRSFTGQVQERVADISTQLQETLTGIRIVKAFTMEKQEQERFVGRNEQTFRAGMKSAQVMATVFPVVELLMAFGLVVVLWYGVREVVAGRLSSGELIAFVSYVSMTAAPINGITRTLNQFQQSFAAADRIFALLDEEIEVTEARRPLELKTVEGRVAFENVTFAYKAGHDVLQDVNLTVCPGEVVALVGPSGAGKTTLANLLLRFYDPTEGRVTLDGVDISKVTLRSLRSYIGLVPQETILFGVSVAENIRYGRQDARFEEIVEAARLANAHDFISELPQGYNTLVGERGVALSGGQRQRVAIARAILRNPRVLILDEATSALDTESEVLVQEALERLMRNRTTLVIAHRLSTIMHADRIVVLDGGHVVEQGTHSELLEIQGLYRRLYEAQFRA
jgi:subfamily B ATP-binding cassette protein MsbA